MEPWLSNANHSLTTHCSSTYFQLNPTIFIKILLFNIWSSWIVTNSALLPSQKQASGSKRMALYHICFSDVCNQLLQSPELLQRDSIFFFFTRNAENTQSLCVHPPPNIADKLKTHHKNTSMVSNLTDSPEGPDSTPLTSSAAVCSAVCWVRQ